MTTSRVIAAATSLVLAGVVVLSGCSSSGPAAPKGPITAAELRQTLVVATDLPATWKEEARKPLSAAQRAADRSDLTSCLGASPTVSAADDAQRVYSDRYLDGRFLVESESVPAPGPTGSALTVSARTLAKAKPCLTSLLRRQLTATLPSTQRLVGIRTDITRPTYDEPTQVVLNIDGVVTVSVDGRSERLYFEDVTLSGPRARAETSFEGVGTPVPDVVRSSVVEAVASRIAKA